MTINIYKNEITEEMATKLWSAVEMNEVAVEQKKTHYVVSGRENLLYSITGIK